MYVIWFPLASYFAKLLNVVFHCVPSFTSCLPTSSVPFFTTISTPLGLLFASLLLSFHSFVTSIFTKYSAGISFLSSTVSSFSGVSKFILPVTLFSILVFVVSTFLYTKLICFSILISFAPLTKVSISPTSSVHVIVLFALLYVPPAIFEFCSAIS